MTLFKGFSPLKKDVRIAGWPLEILDEILDTLGEITIALGFKSVHLAVYNCLLHNLSYIINPRETMVSPGHNERAHPGTQTQISLPESLEIYESVMWFTSSASTRNWNINVGEQMF